MREKIALLKKNDGIVIIEATIVFPVMFFVLFFIIYIGNIYFEIAQMDDVAMRYCIEGAQNISDPMHSEMMNEKLPLDKDIQPYRYIFGEIEGGSIDDIEKTIEDKVETSVTEKTISFFKNMEPEMVGTPKAEFNNYVLYSTFSVEFKYEITFPIKFFGSSKEHIAELSSRAEVSVNDTTEFVRNTDMVIDLLEGTKFGDKIESLFNKIKEFLNKFTG